jgi:hypothetical protein
MLLILYVKTDLIPHVTDVVSSSEGTGILGKMGNKGGVSIRLKLHNSTFCFVCSHLAAHNKNVKRRNKDWDDIMKNTVLALPNGQCCSFVSPSYDAHPQCHPFSKAPPPPPSHVYLSHCWRMLQGERFGSKITTMWCLLETSTIESQS